MYIQILGEKLLYAIHHCSAIDTDFTHRGTVLLDNEVEEAELEYIDDTEADQDASQHTSEMPVMSMDLPGALLHVCILHVYVCN